MILSATTCLCTRFSCHKSCEKHRAAALSAAEISSLGDSSMRAHLRKYHFLDQKVETCPAGISSCGFPPPPPAHSLFRHESLIPSVSVSWRRLFVEVRPVRSWSDFVVRGLKHEGVLVVSNLATRHTPHAPQTTNSGKKADAVGWLQWLPVGFFHMELFEKSFPLIHVAAETE